MQNAPGNGRSRWLPQLRLPRPGWERVAAFALLTLFIILRAIDPPWLELLRHKTFDYYQTLKPRIVTASPVVVVDIDERSLRSLGQWPWPRTLLADLVSRLAEYGVAAVTLDIILAESDRMSPDQLAARIGGLDESTRDRLKALPSNEQLLADAMRRTRVVISQAGLPQSLAPGPTGEMPRTSIATVGGDVRPFLLDFPGLLHNRTEIEMAAAGRGLATFWPDRDGVIRRMPAVMVAGGYITPALGIETFRAATGTPTVMVRRDQVGINSLVVAGVAIATDRTGQVWLHHAHHTPGRFVSAADVLAGKASQQQMRGKIALIGSSSGGLFDLRTTPLERIMPGVELHAQMIENIIGKSLLTNPNYALGAEIVAAAIAGAVMIIVVPMGSALANLIFGLVIVGILGGGAWHLFDQHKLLLDFVYPLLTSFVLFLLLTFQNYFREEARRKRLSRLQGFLSPQVAEVVASDAGESALKSHRRDVTVLFCDLRGFTAFAEAASPEDLMEVLREYHQAVGERIFHYQGTLERFAGDGIMVFFNDPIEFEDHCERAVRLGIDIRNSVMALSQSWQKRGFQLGVGVGIAVGYATLGRIGFEKRFDYAAIGPVTNLAARLCSDAATGQILISQGVAAAVEGRIPSRQLDDRALKGLRTPAAVFEL